jgi:carboxymethylenebutenolidase
MWVIRSISGSKSLVGLALVLAVLMGTSQVQAQGFFANLFGGMCVQQSCATFKGPLGHSVTMEQYLPKSGGRAPAILLLHGSDGMSRFAEGYREAAKALAAQGYAAFIVHYYEGSPNSPRPGPEDRSLPDPSAFYPWLATTHFAVSYISSLPCVDSNRIGLVGFSLGGYLASAAATQDSRVKATVVLSGGIANQFASRARRVPPTMIVHGQQDDTVPVQEAYKLHVFLAKKRVPQELVIFPCEGHLPFESCKAAAAKRVLDFLNCYL